MREELFIQNNIDDFLNNDRKAPGLIFTVLWVLACIPILVTDILPLQDYPAHVARLYILNGGIENDIIATYFGVNWHFVTNLALEIFTYPFLSFLSPDLAGRLFICAAFFLLTSGTIGIHRALGGRGYWPYVSFILLYNMILIFGFLSFIFSCGIALWGFVLWLKWRQSHNKTQPHTKTLAFALPIFAIFLLVCHLFAFCFYALMVGAYELSALMKRLKAGERLISVSIVVGAVQFIPAIIIFIIISETVDAASVIIFGGVKSKLAALASLITLYDIKLQLSVVVGLLFILYVALDKKWLVFNKNIRLYFWLALVIFIAAPIKGFASFYLDYRMPVVFILPLLASITVAHKYDKSSIMVGVIVVMSGLHYAYIDNMWSSYQTYYQDMFDVTEDLKPGDTLMHVTHGNELVSETLAPPLIHAPSLLIPGRQVITPYVFADPRHQPIYYKDDLPFDVTPGIVDVVIPHQTLPELKAEYLKLHTAGFTAFDYLLLINFNRDFMAKSHIWSLQKSQGSFLLYKKMQIHPFD